MIALISVCTGVMLWDYAQLRHPTERLTLRSCSLLMWVWGVGSAILELIEFVA